MQADARLPVVRAPRGRGIRGCRAPWR
jgi:hypothetical protein